MCPWDGFANAWGAPNIDWCEASLCGWITEPANTWSNLAYFVVAAFLWRDGARRFAGVVTVMGALSMVYHASNTFALQILDFLGMFMTLSQLLPVPPLAFVGAMLAALFGMRAMGLRYQSLVLIGIIAALVANRAAPRQFWVGVGVLGAAFVFSILDATRAWCDPNNHVLQGHAVWHVLSAAAMWFIRSESRGGRAASSRS